MQYPDTVDILWGRFCGGLKGKDYSDWATGLLVEGKDFDEIAVLAGHDDLHWQDREMLFKKILAHLKIEIPPTTEELCKVVEKRALSQYVSGEIDEVELVNVGYTVWRYSDYDSKFSLWADLHEDIVICKSEYDDPIVYQLDPDNLQISIKTVLKEQGYLH